MKAHVTLPSNPSTLSDTQKFAAMDQAAREARASQSCAVVIANNLGISVVGSVAVPNAFEALVNQQEALALAARIDVDHIEAVGQAGL